MKKYALIVAGGKGLRMGGELPKQFIPLGDGVPVLMHTIKAFYSYEAQIEIILVLPGEQQAYWSELCKEKGFQIQHTLVDGGETRFHSVRNGLTAIREEGLVGVHDGVRPFVSKEVIAHCFDRAAICKAAIPVVGVFDTMRSLTNTGSHTVNRNNYCLVQTPQVFDVALLKRAYQQQFTPDFTDDASVVEATGMSVSLVEGNRENIKITTPFDLKIASTLI